MIRSSVVAGMDKVSGFGLKAFSQDELDLIHCASMDLLWHTGIYVESEKAVNILHGSGASVERRGDRTIVKIPPFLIEDCIRSAPSHIVLHGRDPRQDYTLEPMHFGFTLFGENTKVNDLLSGENRSCKKKDLEDAIRVADALDQIVIVTKCMGAQDKPSATQALHNFEAMVSNTGKHVAIGPFSAVNCRKIVEMGAACIGGIDEFQKRPFITFVVCPSSPLTLVNQCTEVIIESARLGIGICSIPMPLCGATSTCTLAGTLVSQNAEVLSSLVLTQLVAKGTPFIYGSCATIMDMKLGNAALGAPEYGLLSVGATRLAQYYKIPNWCGSGVSDSKLPDAQSAYEFAMNTTMSALAGGNIIFSCGSLESGLTFDFAKLIMDAEHAERLKIAVGGIDVTHEEIALNVLKEVGPGGEFLTHNHTLENMGRLSQSNLFDRTNREAWLEHTGGKDLTERAYETAKYLLEHHKPMELPIGAAEAMRGIIKEREAEIEIEDNR